MASTRRCAATSKARGVEDLRADVAVQADEFERVRVLQDASDGLGRRAAGEGEAEFLVLVRGGDELVGVGLDADRSRGS